MRAALTTLTQGLLGIALAQGLMLLVLGGLPGCGTPEVVPNDFPVITQDVPTSPGPDLQGDQGQDTASDRDPGDGGGPDGEPGDGGGPDVIKASCYAINKVGECAKCATPGNDDQFLNQCTAAACEAFDNAARLPRLLPNGDLPPLE